MFFLIALEWTVVKRFMIFFVLDEKGISVLELIIDSIKLNPYLPVNWMFQMF